MSFQAKPCFSRFSFSTLSAAASPPDVHQWSISTSFDLRPGAGGRDRSGAKTLANKTDFTHHDVLLPETATGLFPCRQCDLRVQPRRSRIAALPDAVASVRVLAAATATVTPRSVRGAKPSPPHFRGGRSAPSPVPIVRRALLAEARGALAPVLGRRGERAGDGLEGGRALLALRGVDRAASPAARRPARRARLRGRCPRRAAEPAAGLADLVRKSEPRTPPRREIVSPVRARRFTACGPARRTRRCVPDQPGTVPIPALRQAEPACASTMRRSAVSGEFEPAAERVAVQHRDQRLPQPGEPVEDPMPFADPGCATCRGDRAPTRRRCRRRRRTRARPRRSG